MALITEDRKLTGLNLSGTVKENISLASLKKFAKGGILDKKQELKVANQYVKDLGIKTPSANAMVSNLSGGNQQKVVLAKWLVSQPDIIIFDEPTRGIDVGAKRDIYLLINNLAKAGKGVIMISSEMPEIIGICDRALIMCEGQITGELYRSQFSQELIMAYASRKEGKPA
jgi:ribose transport system ATP-binding protein/inositol transport system ATP-binding protein